MQTKMLLPSDPPRETDSSEEEAALTLPRRRIAARVGAVCAAAAGAALLLNRSWGVAPAKGAAPAAIEFVEEGEPGAPPAALKEDAVAPRLCTDGWSFSFSSLVSVQGAGQVDLLTSSEGALKLTAEAKEAGVAEVTLSVTTFDYGSVSVTAELRGDDVVTAEKTNEGICLTTGAAAEKVCTFPDPEEVPPSGFQMKTVGELTLGEAAAVAISEFEQTAGFTSVSLGLSGVTFDQLYKHEVEYEKFVSKAGETIAYVAGNGVAPDEVHTFVAAGDKGTAVVQSTIVSPVQGDSGMACKVQDAVKAAIGSGYLGAVFKERLAAAESAYGASVVSAAAPAVPMPTEAATCRHTERRELVEGSMCAGFGCVKAACEEAAIEEEANAELNPLPETPARASAGEPVVESYGHKVHWQGFKPEEVEVPMTAWEPAGHDWMQLATKDSFAGAEHIGDLHTDGHKVDFEVDLTFSPGAFNIKQVIVVAEPGDGLSLSTVRTTLAGKGTLRLEGSLLSGLGHGGCSVESVPVEIGTTATVRVTRDYEQCCVSVSGEAQCVQLEASAKDVQMRPGDRVVKPKGCRSVSVNNYRERSGSLTLSFSVSHIKYDDVIGKCNCLDEVVAAIKQSVAYWGAVGTTEDQVTVSLKRGAEFPEGTDVPKLSEKQLVKLHREFKDRLELRGPTISKEQAFLEHMREEVIKKIETGDEKKEKPADRRLAGSLPEPTRSIFKYADAPASYVQALTDALKAEDPSFTGTAIDALSVQVTLGSCNGQCASTAEDLKKPKFASILSERLLTVVAPPKNPLRGATTGTVSIRDVHCPAEVTTCGQVTCDDDFLVNTHPNLPCIGGEGCQKKCCRPRTCAEVQCQAPLKKIWGPGAWHKTCTSQEDCLDTCCVQSCVGVKCYGDSVCLKHDAWMLWAKPSNPQETCCYQKDPKCGTAHTAWCASCHMCMKPKSYCKKHLHHAGALRRRLRGEDDIQNGGDDQAVAEAQVPAQQHTPEELEADLREAEENLQGLLNVTSASTNLQGRRLAEIDVKRAAMQSKLMGDAIRRIKASKGKSFKMTPVRGHSFKGAEKWNAAVKKAPGLIPGCGAPGGSLACKYYLESVFTLGRCHGPSSVNTVAILTDTVHAVSCGSDGICWVWKIKTGVPISVWVPDALCDTSARAPVRSVTPFYDATYILSAGQKTEDPADGGVAYIWDWRKGFGIKKIECDGGAYLSSANMPMWRMILLGCSNSFITVQNWATGNSLDLPYHAKTKDEIRENIAGRLENFLENNVDGIVRLKVTKQLDHFNSLQQAWLDMHPELADTIEAITEAGDRAFDFVNGNYFGAVESIAYVPTGQRFVSGHADGNMRLWDAASGTLLRIMTHSRYGRVNAVAGFPNDCMAASGGDDGIVKIWELKSGLQVHTFNQVYGGPVRAVQVVPGGKQVVVGSDDGYVRIWEVERCKLLCAFFVSHATITSIAVNPSNPLDQLVVASADGIVRVFNPYKGGVDSLEYDGR